MHRLRCARFNWAGWIGYLAALVLLLHGLAHAYWAFGGDGLPFGADDANPEYSAFEHVGRDRLAPWTAGGFLGSAAVALLLALPGRRRIPARVLMGASVFSAAAVFCTLADFRILGNLAYVFMLKFGAINWTVVNQLFAGAALATMGALGSLLTLGLVRRWGEVFPRWMVGLRGRRVPLSRAWPSSRPRWSPSW